jgi:signal transduction histidine kinase
MTACAAWPKQRIRLQRGVRNKIMRVLPTFSIRNILLLTIGTLTFLITSLVVKEVFVQWRQLDGVASLKRASLIGDELFNAGEKISEERHISFSILHASDPAVIRSLQSSLNKCRQESDMTFGAAMTRLEKYRFSDLQPETQDIEKEFKAMQTLRPAIDQAVSLPLNERDPTVSDRWFQSSSGVVEETQKIWSMIINDFINVDPIVTAQMRFKYFLWIATEYTGRERSMIGRLIVEDNAPTHQEQALLLRWQGVVDYFWSSVNMVADQSKLGGVLGPYLKDAKSDYDNVYDMVQGTFLLPGVKLTKPYPINGDLWLELSTQSNDSLYKLKDVTLKETSRYVETLETKARRAIFIQALALLFTLLLCAYSFQVILRRVLHPINTMIEALIAATQGKAVSPALLQVKQDDEIGKLAHVLSVFQKNVDELKHSSIILGRYIEELKRSNQELDDFAYIASHDLKEPVRGLITQATFLLEDYQNKLDMEAIRRLRRLIFLSERMEQLVTDLLYFSRLGRTELAVKEVDPNEIVAEVRQMMDTFLKERNARVTIPQRMPNVVCDKLRVAEVFRNLITNAIKYNDKPERLVEVGFLENVKTSHGNEKNVFYVKDNGVGIEPEFHEAIFRIFKRLKNPAVKDEDGTGSGLTFVKKIIERHKGRIWLNSEPGKGSTFYFTLGAREA